MVESKCTIPTAGTEGFVRGIENAFRHFGGVPEILVLDNLKASCLLDRCRNGSHRFNKIQGCERAFRSWPPRKRKQSG